MTAARVSSRFGPPDVDASRFALRRAPLPRALLDVSLMLRRERPTVGALLKRLGPRGAGLILIILTLPALVPIPGPFGMIFGSILALLTAQLARGAESLWLPRFLRDRQAPVELLRLALRRATPWAARLATGLREGRLARLTGPRARALVAAPLFVMALIIVVPLPLGNVAPAVAVLVSASALVARDGLALMVGMALSIIAVAWTALLIVAGTELAFALWRWAPI